MRYLNAGAVIILGFAIRATGASLIIIPERDLSIKNYIVGGKMLLQQDRALKLNVPPLSSIYFYLTSYCNLRCSHCWISPEYIDNDEAPKEADFGLLKDIIGQAMPMGLKSIKITGGEPFLSKNINQLIIYAFSKKLAIDIETNATLIDEAMARFLKENSVNHIAVSLDGPNQEIHERIRNKNGCFKKTMEGIKALKKCGLNVQVIMSLCRDNAGYLEETISLTERYGVNSFKINCISDISRGEALKEKGMTLRASDYIELNNKVENEIQPKHKIRIIFDIPPAFKALKNIKTEKCVCGIKNILGIMPDGDISICGIGKVLTSLRLGSMQEESLRKIWEDNEILRIIREELPSGLKDICGRCILKALCLGKCRAESYYKNNDLLSPFSFCDEAFRSGLFPKNRILYAGTEHCSVPAKGGL